MTDSAPPPVPAPALPQSTALAEATGDSIAELLSRDPEHYQAQDLDRVIEFYRAQRQRWVAAGGEEPKAKAKPKASSNLLTQTMASAEDMGL